MKMHENAIFEVEHGNHAWSRAHHGFYIDAEGNVYKYNYGNYKPEPEHERVGTVSFAVLSEKAALIEEASSGEIVETSVACDAGATDYLAYFFNPVTQTRKRVLLFADGNQVKKNTSSAANALTDWLKSVLEQFDPSYKPQDNRSIHEKIADVLKLIATKPNLRDRPLENDLQGYFTHWFDGGAVNELTGATHYYFADGTSASTSVSNHLSVSITFNDGTKISVTEKPFQKRISISPNFPEFVTPPPAPTIPLPVTNLPQTNAEFGTRPEIWYCLFCGCLGGLAENNNMCLTCKTKRPVFDDGITFINCLHCGQYNPLFSPFCEWCGANLKGR